MNHKIPEGYKECGKCNKLILAKDKKGRIRNFCQGHYIKPLKYDRTIMIKCSCNENCNTLIHKYDKRGRERSYFKDHKPKGIEANSWNGGSWIDKRGYRRIYRPDHPNSHKDGYILEHRFIMSEYLGRILLKDEVVHHKNKNKLDNMIHNLELVNSNGDHISEYHKKDTSNRICSECKTNISFDGKYNHWYKNPLINNEFLCINCYQKVHRTLNK